MRTSAAVTTATVDVVGLPQRVHAVNVHREMQIRPDGPEGEQKCQIEPSVDLVFTLHLFRHQKNLTGYHAQSACWPDVCFWYASQSKRESLQRW